MVSIFKCAAVSLSLSCFVPAMIALAPPLAAHPNHSESYEDSQPAILTGPSVQSEISGYTGTLHRAFVALPGEAVRAVRGFRIYERGNDPCTAHVDFGTLRESGETWNYNGFTNCNGNLKYSVLAGSNLVYKVQVCTNASRNNDRRYLVKGIKLWAREILSDGSMRDVALPVSGQEPNCENNWGDVGTAECPSGHVAKDVNLYGQTIGNQLSLTGISLNCARVILHEHGNQTADTGDTPPQIGTPRPRPAPQPDTQPGQIPDIGSFQPRPRPDPQTGSGTNSGNGTGTGTDTASGTRNPTGIVPIPRPTPGDGNTGQTGTPQPAPNSNGDRFGYGNLPFIRFTGAAAVRTDIAGQTGTTTPEVIRPECVDPFGPNPPGTYCGLREIGIQEKGDEPCKAWGRSEGLGYEDTSLPASGSSPTPVEALSPGCDINEALNNSARRVDMGVRSYIRRVQVCTNGNANRAERRMLVKGIRGYGYRISTSPPALRDVPRLEAVQPNCTNNWAENGTATCPADHIAVSVIVHRRNIGGQRAIVGMQLDCRRVVFYQ